MKDKKFITLSALFFFIFIAGIGILVIEKPAANLLRAKNEAPSPLKSFAVAFPQVGVATIPGSSSKGTQIKVSVYMRDVNGSVLADRTVRLTSSLPSVIVSPADTQVTNNIGQAQFMLTSDSAGKAILTATDVGSNTSVVNIPTVEFTQ